MSMTGQTAGPKHTDLFTLNKQQAEGSEEHGEDQQRRDPARHFFARKFPQDRIEQIRDGDPENERCQDFIENPDERDEQGEKPYPESGFAHGCHCHLSLSFY